MKIYFIITGVLLVIIGSFVLFAYVPAARTRFANLFPSNILPATSRQQVKINGHTISIQVATTDAQKRQGLSDRDSLPQDAGMLFLFDHPDYYLFWMRHMKIPLDIIYLNGNKIVTMMQDVKNPPYSVENPPILKPIAPADKVLEVNAGTAKKYNLKIGDSIDLTL